MPESASSRRWPPDHGHRGISETGAGQWHDVERTFVHRRRNNLWGGRRRHYWRDNVCDPQIFARDARFSDSRRGVYFDRVTEDAGNVQGLLFLQAAPQ